MKKIWRLIKLETLRFMKVTMGRCLSIPNDVEITTWTCLLFWFSISIVLISGVFGYIGRHHF